MKNPDQLFSYDFEYLWNLYQALGGEGRNYYFRMLGVDYIYTVLSGIGYSLLLAALVKKEKWFIILPLIIAAFDAGENISQMLLMHQFPSISPIGTHISSTFSSIKLSLSLVYLLLVLFYAGKNSLKWIKERSQKH